MLRTFRNWLPGVLFGLAATAAWPQSGPAAPAAPTSLKEAFDAAWARQPEAQSRDLREKAAVARRQIADRWTAEPPALEMSGKTDQLSGDDGNREYEVGVAVPLWLPGERASSGALADAQLRASGSRVHAAQLRAAADVRAAYWDWQRAAIESGLARERLASARELADDVARRVQAGDLARADQHQAEGAAAAAEAALAAADAALTGAAQDLRALTGTAPMAPREIPLSAETEPGETFDALAIETRHPALAELLDRTEAARRAVALAGVQSRANPELRLAATRERELSGEPWLDTVTVGVRFPFGAGPGQRAHVAEANAEAIEAQAQLQLERERVLADIVAARARLESARAQLASAERRTRLAQESREFFQKAFRLGETDLPTRLRIELEAAEADRQLARSRVELAAAISALRQAWGLLPE